MNDPGIVERLSYREPVPQVDYIDAAEALGYASTDHTSHGFIYRNGKATLVANTFP